MIENLPQLINAVIAFAYMGHRGRYLLKSDLTNLTALVKEAENKIKATNEAG